VTNAALGGQRDLFFEKRGQDDCRRAPVFEAPDSVEIASERRRTGDERVRNSKPLVTKTIERSCL